MLFEFAYNYETNGDGDELKKVSSGILTMCQNGAIIMLLTMCQNKSEFKKGDKIC